MAITYLQAHPVPNWYSERQRRSLCRASDGRIYLSYRVAGVGFYEAWIGYSDDNGVTWTFEKIPGQIPGDTNEVISLAIDSNDNLIAVWQHYVPPFGNPAQIYYRRRLASGAWDPVIVVANPGAPAIAHAPSVAIDSSDTAHIVWSEMDHDIPGQHDDIRYNTVDAAGVLGAQIDVSAQGFLFRNTSPVIAVCKNDIAHITWNGTGLGAFPARQQIKYNTVTGGVLGVTVLLTNNDTLHLAPVLATDSNGNVHIVWIERLALPTAGFNYINNIGGAWNPAIQLNNYNNEAGMSITIDAEDNIYAFHCQIQWPNATQKIYKNGVEEYSIVMQGGGGAGNDIYTMHSWYPRSGGSSPNILSNNWLAYSFWPINLTHAFLMIGADLIIIPTPTTEAANNISQPGATLNGVLDDDGGEACDCWFEHGVPGGTTYTTPLQTKSSGELFSQALTGLTPDTRYQFRAVARNSTGITYGTNMYFVTESPPLREFSVVQQEILELLRR